MRVLEVGRDITVQLRAEEALRENEKLAAMGRVAGIIAHEINNPLAAITNIFYLLRNHPSLDEEARRMRGMAEQELQRVWHITRQTLSFYRESKQPIPVMHSRIASTMYSNCNNAKFRSAGYTSARSMLPTIPVHGFPVELRQVILNLITNAIHAMPGGGQLHVYVRQATDWAAEKHGIALTISDTGIGIRREDAERLFEPFYSTKSAKGTGLGLWISKGIIQKYGGQINFRCYTHKNGSITCFRVFIPLNSSVAQNSGSVGDAGRAERERGAESTNAPARENLQSLPEIAGKFVAG